MDVARQNQYAHMATKDDPLSFLAGGSALLYLSVETPKRIAGWDAIVLTAANRHQARLYEIQLEAARKRGLIGEQTITFVADDPGGRRIGSGGATLNALRHMAQSVGPEQLARMRTLLIHAGGDSKRVPWANVFGKCFIPFPLFADPDRPVPAVFDHQLAVCAPLALRMPRGGLVSLAGDVLPLFAASRVNIPEDGAVVVTARASLDVAERHGVIVAGADGRVVDLLQKMPAAELVGRGALVGGAAALLDTGIYALAGRAYESLIRLAASQPDPVAELTAAGVECSLYEEIASALVPSRHGWLSKRPLGRRLLTALGPATLWNHLAGELAFVHFGTTAEVLVHLADAWEGKLARRVLSECGSGVAPSAVVCASKLADMAAVGRESMVYGSRLGNGVHIGNRCVVMGVEAVESGFRLPNNTCLWQTPVRRPLPEGGLATVTACCGVEDNPKDPFERATFCNQSLQLWLTAHGLQSTDLWQAGEERTLWNARLFAAGSGADGLCYAAWLLGSGQFDGAGRSKWLAAKRLSLADLQHSAEVTEFAARLQGIGTNLVLEAIEQTAESSLDRNVAALAAQLDSSRENMARLEAFGHAVARSADEDCPAAPASRLAQLRADLLVAQGKAHEGAALAALAFNEVRKEVTDHVAFRSSGPVSGVKPGRSETVRLPVRFDMAGGWSDTPPYCLEKPACVLNMAITLDGELPVRASVEALPEPRWHLVLEDAGMELRLESKDIGDGALDPRDPFALLKGALLIAGYGTAGAITQGARVRTRATAPKGSGLGTSSILGAALLKALMRLAGRADDTETVADMVLLLEQRLTTGGGWQDQVGGLVPGVKCISSVPVRPIRLTVEPVPLLPGVVEELERRLIIAFTGRERLAKNVLQIVVSRYLQRDSRAIGAIGRLVRLAHAGRMALALGNIDDLGEIMAEAWEVHQELDPHCSNAEVDEIFNRLDDLIVGGKLAGAGGGGFIGVVARDSDTAARVKQVLSAMGGGVRVYNWRLALNA